MNYQSLTRSVVRMATGRGVDDVSDAEVQRVTAAFQTLEERLKKVLSLRFEGKGRTFEEVGSLLGMHRERIRQIEVKALRILAPYLKK